MKSRPNGIELAQSYVAYFISHIILFISVSIGFTIVAMIIFVLSGAKTD